MMLLSIGLLLLPFIASEEYSRGSCLQIINNARALYAKQHKIANMNDLMYNRKMEAAIEQQLDFVNGCPEPSIVSHHGLDIYLNVRGNEELIVDLLAAPDSSMMACFENKCGEEDIFSIATDAATFTSFVGAPGTECPSGRSANSKGLCALRREYQRKNVIDEAGRAIQEGYEKVEEAVFRPPAKWIVRIFGLGKK